MVFLKNAVSTLDLKLWCCICVGFIIFSCANKEDKILPTERALTESVYASATIQPDSLYQVYAIVSGLIDANLVEEGDLVSKDDHLFQIINNTPRLNTQNAKLALNLAQDNYKGNATVLSSIESEISAAKLKFKNDSINYFRQKRLWDQNIGSKAQYDTQKLNYELASNQLEVLQNKLDRTKNELKTAVQQAQNYYQTTAITTKDFTVNSKINGKVYAIFKEPGEVVSSMEPLATIGSEKHFVIELLVDEVDIVKIKKSQEVLINLDAYKDVVFKAKVSKIYPKKDERNQTFLVEALFNKPPEILYPGLSGEANIVISNKANVLTIPIAYLTSDNKVKTDDGLVSVKTGLQNMDYVEILSGITKETYIYKPE
ncbi:multidrug efflux pump subunit AcrA (membrane-fusion protein) [Winogradskyella eximia]|uniref:Multidrug efflux pump subunit AcrA (Membrane-fusion protein) n=1 Tax=Winogradskyella eximia TaxID=262006 RepID=A0A3D9H2W8_9FLAO|nr:HlyD family efflux transporter periplasmic adaptor subunit [Winogradskyella eximia]RED43849.1 multidrug efflux pump subunit AcrA (membrane-fusion protein) [Winogradskyella eximia]